MYFHMLDRCFPKRFVLDSRHVFRMCQQPSGESSQLVTIKFSRVKERGDLDSVSGTRRYVSLVDFKRIMINQPRGSLYGHFYFGQEFLCGGIKNHQITCLKKEPPLCVLFYT